MYIIKKLKFKSDILKSSNKFFCNVFIDFFIIFFIYIKLFKILSAKYDQENKGRLQKNLVKDIKIFLKKKKNKNNSMVVNVTKISQKMKNKILLSVEKNIIE